MLIVPVRPGRNMTTIVEVAARNHLLKLQGHHSAREFQERLNRAIALAPGGARRGDGRRMSRARGSAGRRRPEVGRSSPACPGSGKSTALRALEDAGFYCVDNLPIVFLEKLLELSGAHRRARSRASRSWWTRARGASSPTRRASSRRSAAAGRRRRGAVPRRVATRRSCAASRRRAAATRSRRGGTVPEGIAAERRALARR